MARVTTRQDAANSAAQRWEEQYRNYRGEGAHRKAAIHAALVALGPTPTPEAVNEAIGNDSWTRLECDQCDKPAKALVTVGGVYESRTASLCETCLREDLAMLAQRDR